MKLRMVVEVIEKDGSISERHESTVSDDDPNYAIAGALHGTAFSFCHTRLTEVFSDSILCSLANLLPNDFPSIGILRAIDPLETSPELVLTADGQVIFQGS